MAGGLVKELFASFGFRLQKDTLDRVHSAISGVKAAAVGITAGYGLSGIAHLVEETAHGAVHLQAMSKSLGLSTKSLQEWGFVARAAGSNIDQFSVGISQFEANLSKFSKGRGSKEFAAAMNQVGISQHAAAKILTSPDGLNGAFDTIADKFKKMGNEAERGALGRTLFGARAGRAVVGDLAGGAEAVREMREHFSKIGGVIDDKSINNLKNLNTTIQDLKQTIGAGLANAIGAVGPQIQDMVGSVTTFIATHTKEIGDFVGGLFGGIRDGFKAIGIFVEGLATILSSFLGPAAADMDKFKAIGYAVGAMLTFLAGRFIFAWAAALGPIGIVIAAIVVAVGLISHYWDEIVDGVKTVGAAIRDAFSSAFDFIRNLPVIKQLFDLVDELAKFIGMNASHQSAQQKLDQFAQDDDSPWYAKLAASGNQFLSDHPILSSAAGGGGEGLRREMEDRIVASGPAVVVQQTNQYTINGTDPEAMKRAIEDHHDNQMRDASHAFNQGH